MGEHGIRPCGTRLEGQDPQDLILSDGSRLVLQSATDDDGARWCREVDGASEPLSIERVRELAGPEYAEYVEVRMRSETEWLRALSQWAEEEAERLAEEAAVLA